MQSVCEGMKKEKGKKKLKQLFLWLYGCQELERETYKKKKSLIRFILFLSLDIIVIERGFYKNYRGVLIVPLK